MGDMLQVTIVTAAAAAALATLVWPYVRRSSPDPSAPCTKCVSNRRSAPPGRTH
jgi:hypothetical protein